MELFFAAFCDVLMMLIKKVWNIGEGPDQKSVSYFFLFLIETFPNLKQSL